MKKLIKFDAPELAVIEKSKAQNIKATFEPMAKMLTDFENSFSEIVKESESEITKDLTIRAKRLRLDIGKVRIKTEEIRKAEKEEYLRAGKAIDGVSNILKWAVTDKENKLEEIENYFEIQEQKRKEELQAKRVDEISPYMDDPDGRNYSEMDEDVWQAYLSAKKKDHADRIEAEKKAEEERKEREKQAEELRKENERLRKEAEQKAQQAAKEEAARKAKEDADRKKREEAARKEREAYEAKLKAEREAREKVEREERAKREKLQAEIKAKEDAERKAKEQEEREKIKAQRAPDKKKLLAFSQQISELKCLTVTDKTAKEIEVNAMILLAKVVKYINDRTKEL